jgi:hypothetical protein
MVRERGDGRRRFRDFRARAVGDAWCATDERLLS